MNDLTKTLIDIGLRHVVRDPLARELARVGVTEVDRRLREQKGLAPTGSAGKTDGHADPLAALEAEGIPVLRDARAQAFWKDLRQTEWGNIVVLGRRDSGKTALSLLVAELLGKSTVAIGIDQRLLDRLPFDAEEHDPEALLAGLPNGCTLLIDDAGKFFSIHTYNSKVSQKLRDIIIEQRHHDQHIILNTQLGAILTKYALDPTVLFLKPASMMYADLERPHMKSKFRTAQQAFSLLPVAVWPRYAYVLRDDAEGLIEVELPTGWSAELSKNKRYTGGNGD